MFTGVQSKLIQIKTENQFRKPKPKKTNFFFVWIFFCENRSIRLWILIFQTESNHIHIYYYNTYLSFY
jgi:hypothetical protein